MKGSIKKLISDRSFGFISAEDGKELFFHSSDLEGVEFDVLKEGDNISFEVGSGPKGPKAVHVKKE